MEGKKKRYRPDKDGNQRAMFDAFKRQAKLLQEPCHICGLPINYELKFPHPWSGVIDHIVPISLGGNSMPDNLAAAHNRCNRRKGERIRLSPKERSELRLEQGAGRVGTNQVESDQRPAIKGIKGNDQTLYDQDIIPVIPGVNQHLRGFPQSVNWRTF